MWSQKTEAENSELPEKYNRIRASYSARSRTRREAQHPGLTRVVNPSPLTLISTPGAHVDPRHIFCDIFYDLFVIFLPCFRYSSPFPMSSYWLNITYLGTAQKPAHNILRWGPRGPQAQECWITTQTWVSLFTHWRFLLGNGSPV